MRPAARADAQGGLRQRTLRHRSYAHFAGQRCARHPQQPEVRWRQSSGETAKPLGTTFRATAAAETSGSTKPLPTEGDIHSCVKPVSASRSTGTTRGKARGFQARRRQLISARPIVLRRAPPRLLPGGFHRALSKTSLRRLEGQMAKMRGGTGFTRKKLKNDNIEQKTANIQVAQQREKGYNPIKTGPCPT